MNTFLTFVCIILNFTLIIRLIFTSLSFCGMTIEVVIVFPRNRIKNNPANTGTCKIYMIN